MRFEGGYWALSEGPVKLKETSKANTEMQIAVTMGPPVVLIESNHATILVEGASLGYGPRVTFRV